MTKEGLKNYSKNGCLTVGKLKEFISNHNLSDDSLVLIQRVEDIYYNENNWQTYLKEGENYHNAIQHNKDIDNGKYLDKEQYPDIKCENLSKLDNEFLETMKEQYHPAWCCVNYKDDKDILFIDLHY